MRPKPKAVILIISCCKYVVHIPGNPVTNFLNHQIANWIERVAHTLCTCGLPKSFVSFMKRVSYNSWMCPGLVSVSSDWISNIIRLKQHMDNAKNIERWLLQLTVLLLGIIHWCNLLKLEHKLRLKSPIALRYALSEIILWEDKKTMKFFWRLYFRSYVITLWPLF